MKIHTGDTVLIITGKDKGKQGTVMRVLPLKNRLVVEGVNMRTRHIKKTAQGAGQRIKYEASIHLSNVMMLDPKTKKPTRVGYKIDAKTGEKVRIAKVSGEVLPIVSKVKAAPAKKKTGGKEKDKAPSDAAKTTEKHDDQKPAVEEAAEVKTQGPKKQAFWKRAFTPGAGTKEGTEVRNRQEEIDKNAPGSIRRSRESS